jgi:hypothetical protein
LRRKIAAFGCNQGFTGRIRLWFFGQGAVVRRRFNAVIR